MVENGREKLISARYVVGADGMQSLVRRSTGIEFDGSVFEEISSTHYGRMVHLDDRTILFASPEDAAEYIGFDLTVN